MHFLGKLENERKSSKNLLYRNWFGGDIQKFNDFKRLIKSWRGLELKNFEIKNQLFFCIFAA
ncbi:hypothetical protein HMPREF1154_2066 [Capnocytophaga sp. CM59]|nr:hypothetical protein HMPREF1154_2066 [Capnocytophaga sp. CM59]